MFNLATLAVVGYVAERALGPARWVVLYAAGAAAGEVTGYLLNDPGAGNSIAVCGLAGGGALALSALERSVGARYAVMVGFSAFAGSTLGAIVMVAGCAAAVLLVVHRDRVPASALAAAPLVVGLALAAVPDLHGPALLGGLIAGWVTNGMFPSTPRSAPLA
ncbi:hypothetical protein ACFSKW_32085 [Nonomuraea mangrovi]|uniref:Peptidase S54 rhomboid domain-containing protein n=1 Tax=Nonomuraea mangrovi TaxID=2316207 RepID=A0ABW4T4U5_9ACTN